MSQEYYILNADMMNIVGIRPSQCPNGTVFTLPTEVKGCPWKPGPSTIPPGTYKVTSRKYFRGGTLVVEQCGC